MEFEIVDLSKNNLETLSWEIHATNIQKGFWDEGYNFTNYGLKLALIHSEITEILEALRKHKGEEEVAKEFSDVIIRVLDLWHALKQGNELHPNADLENVIQLKMKENATRPKMHGHRFG